MRTGYSECLSLRTGDRTAGFPRDGIQVREDDRQIMNRELNIRYALLQGAHCSAFAACNVYAVVILRSFGAGYGQAGILTAVLNLTVMVLMQRFSVLADRRGAGTNRRIAAAAFIAAAAVCILFLLIDPYSPAAGIPMYLFVLGSMSFVTPFLDAFSVEYIHRGGHINYGAARGIGSVCYAAASAAVSPAFANDGRNGVLLVFLAADLAAILVLWTMPALPEGTVRRLSAADDDRLSTADARESKDGTADSAFTIGTAEMFRVYRWLVLFLMGLLFLRLSHQMITAFMDAVVTRAGADVGRMGLISGLGTAAEIPFMLAAERLGRKWKPEGLLLIAGTSMVLRMLCFVLARSLFWLIMAMLLQGPEFGLLTPAVVYFLAERVDTANQSKAQTLNAVSFTISTAASSVIAGAIIDGPGTGAAMVTGLCCAAAGLCLLWSSFRRLKRKKGPGPVPGGIRTGRGRSAF